MSIIIGSARIDENGHACGGKAGDQTGREVCMQNFYESEKGWYVLIPKSSEHAKKIANNMKIACNNNNIGYDQNGRYGVIKYGVATKTKTEADCSSLVRACIKEATGKDPGDFNTSNEASVLEKTGLFEKRVTYTPGMSLPTGTVLVTKSKGHTVIVVEGKSAGTKKPTTGTSVAQPTLKKGSKGSQVILLQRNLNKLKYVGKNKKSLAADGDFGENTEYALKSFQKAKGLENDGIYGPKSYEAMKKSIK